MIVGKQSFMENHLQGTNLFSSIEYGFDNFPEF